MIRGGRRGANKTNIFHQSPLKDVNYSKEYLAA
jgi:hypothetical protein